MSGHIGVAPGHASAVVARDLTEEPGVGPRTRGHWIGVRAPSWCSRPPHLELTTLHGSEQAVNVDPKAHIKYGGLFLTGRARTPRIMAQSGIRHHKATGRRVHKDISIARWRANIIIILPSVGRELGVTCHSAWRRHCSRTTRHRCRRPGGNRGSMASARRQTCPWDPSSLELACVVTNAVPVLVKNTAGVELASAAEGGTTAKPEALEPCAGGKAGRERGTAPEVGVSGGACGTDTASREGTTAREHENETEWLSRGDPTECERESVLSLRGALRVGVLAVWKGTGTCKSIPRKPPWKAIHESSRPFEAQRSEGGGTIADCPGQLNKKTRSRSKIESIQRQHRQQNEHVLVVPFFVYGQPRVAISQENCRRRCRFEAERKALCAA